MKKLLYILVAFWVFSFSSYAQKQSDHKGSVLSGGLIFKDTNANLQMQMQIGAMFQYPPSVTTNVKAGFPFGVLYLPSTFSEKTFEVSKGYYPDVIKVNWSIGSNEDRIAKINVYRKELRGDSAYTLLATVGKNDFEFIDTQIEAGVLYQYKVEAVGISNIEQKYVTFIEGVGFRSPTANVSGSIVFEGGSPVKDVKVLAEALGSEGGNQGTSILFDGNYSLQSERLDVEEKEFSATSLTFQGWVAPKFDKKENKVIVATTTKGLKYQLFFEAINDNGTRKLNVSLNDGNVFLQKLTLSGSYPTGEIDFSGKDVFGNLNDLVEGTFMHVSVVLDYGKKASIYVNGRPLTNDYISNAITKNVTQPTLTVFENNVNTVTKGDEIVRLSIADNFTGNIDEVRVWSKALTSNIIRRDYRRLLSGGESRLEMYYRFNEGYGDYAYDISKKGFKFNKRHLAKNIINNQKINYDTAKPTKEQLGVFGITDKDGAYTISAIPYIGNGEQFKITPSFGVHKFKPASQTLFLGKDEAVVNKLDFEDISSFKFNGRVVFDVRGVFKDEAFLDPTVNDSNPVLEAVNKDGKPIREVGYNQYLVDGTTTIFKGEYYYEANEGEEVTVDTNTGNLVGGTLKRYPVIGVEKANLYIDGNVVYDEDNQPVVTNADGKFSINVPIGKHKIEVKKQNHSFVFKGRFPEKNDDATQNLFDFYEDQIQERWFIDDTRVTVVGRVIGGRKESEKEIGFGFDGLKEHENTVAEGKPKNIQTYSSINNIGQATITLKGKKGVNDLDFIFNTNKETGEYKISIIPYIFHIEKNKGIKIASNPSINNSFIDSDEELDFTTIKPQEFSSFTALDGTKYKSQPYQYVKNFRYNSDIIVKLIHQDYEESFSVNNKEYNIASLSVPVYEQKKYYRYLFEVTQNYVNKDDGLNKVTQEYFNEGRFNITNNFASSVPKDTSIEIIKNKGKEQYVYKFKAGLPNISQKDGFKESVTVEYNVAGQNPIGISNITDFKSQGIVIGARNAEGTAFSTAAPDVPDIILRDPPGSNSFASIEKGTTISFESTNSDTTSDVHGGGYYVSVAPTWEFNKGGIGFFVGTEMSIVAEQEGNFSKTTENTDSGSTVETYHFNETISTSDDPSFVGADGDLYIGNSKNIFYGLCDKMFITKEVPKLPNNTEIPHIKIKVKDKDDKDVSLYICSRKSYYIAEQPSSTFFMYTQKYILETLIPNLQSIADNLKNGKKPDPSKEYQTPEFYLNQIKSWQRIIQDNERDKYLALSERNTLKSRILVKNSQQIRERQQKIQKWNSHGYIEIPDKFIEAKKNDYINGLNELIRKNFESNKSFDAGVGEFTSSVTTSIVNSKSHENFIDVSREFQARLGLLINNMGGVGHYSNTHSKIETTSETTSREFTTTISYTLKDNDSHNALSVDVVNPFDGSGPIFITKGGYTSCPQETKTVSNFFKKNNYNSSVVGKGGEKLSEGTVAIYNPEIKSDKTLITNVPESDEATFILKLKNASPIGKDLEHLLFVDNASLGGAKSNVDQNGITISLPYNETVEFPLTITKKTSLSKYKYDDIKVYIGDPCNGLYGTSSIELSVEFKKSCSKVSVSAPQDNWVFNRAEAFSYDAQGKVTNNVLPIKFTDFNTDFSGFRKIELQYRNANASSWSKFKTYYGTQQLKDEASDDKGIVINSESEFTYNWDILGSKIADGNYEIRAVAYCSDNVTYESKVVNGTINLAPPVVFGTPQPSDGILDIGEDIKVRFNEPIQKSTFTNITLRGLKNQQAIDHSVSVALDGSANQIELPKQNLQSKNFTLQFWLHSTTTGNGVLLAQENGPKISLNGNKVIFELGGEKAQTNIDNSQYNFYSFLYKGGDEPYLEILENGKVLTTKTLTKELSFDNNNSIFIGGTNIKGNIHDIRIWSKATTPGLAAAEKDFTLTGKEPNLVGYWLLNEGHGVKGAEKVRSRNAKVGLSWTIKPKGEGYEFGNKSYLTFDNVGFVQPTNFEDITLSFWVKAKKGDTGTIFGNGTGRENLGEPKLTNGFRNKWDLSLANNGKLNLVTEGNNYELTNSSVTDGNWHHIALVVRRSGSLNSYVDGEQHLSTSSKGIGGIAGSKLYLGARYKRHIPVNANGVATGNATETIENHFTGKLDEFRLWNTARSFEQLKRDRYFELDRETTGLMLYVNFNKNEVDDNVIKGPRYNIRKGDGTTLSYLSLLNGATRKFIADSPSIKPALPYINIPYTTVINGDEIIINPTLTAEEWSLFEGQILDISVASMYDLHFNKQLSPVSFSAYVNRQEVQWFTEAGTKEIVTRKTLNKPYGFTMSVVNKSGNNQDFEVSDVPTWMKVSSNKGTVGPNSTKQLSFTVDSELAMGSYTANVYLKLANGYSDKLKLKLRVLQDAPDWSVNPAEYSYSMNVIGQIKLDDVLSRDTYTKVGAFINGEPRGEAYLTYDEGYDSYYASLTVYSNVASSENVTFKVWDALNGKIRVANINGEKSTNFVQNEVLGNYGSPTVFSAADYLEQNIKLNKGWTWVSFYVKDNRFNNIDELFKNAKVTDGDIIKSNTKFSRYEAGSWSGSLTDLSNNTGYKVKLGNENTLRLVGNGVKEDQVNLTIKEGWNWLSFPIHRNMSIAEALAYYTPKAGDVIKDQFNFAIFDSNANEWKGTLRYLQANRGYMLKSGTAQKLNYPNINYAGRGVTEKRQEHTPKTIKNFASYAHNMSVIAEVVTPKQYEEVRVYDKNGVLRGVSEITEVNGKQLSFISVFSNEKGEFNYVLANKNEQLEVLEMVTFVPNKIEGTLEKPIQLGKNALSNDTLILEGLALYPNPFSNELHINVANAKVAKVVLYNALGKKVKELTITDKITTIPTENLASGMYVLRLQDTAGKYAIRKVIKQ